MKIIKTLFVAAFALVAGYSVYSTQQNTKMSDLAMANIEALSQTETSGSSCHYQITYSCMEISYIVPWRPVGIYYPDHYGN